MYRFSLYLSTLFLLFAVSQTQAHFLWLVATPDGYQVVFTEEPEIGPADLIEQLPAPTVWQTSPTVTLRLKLDQKIVDDLGWLDCTGATLDLPIQAKATWGTLTRGGKTFLISYFARSYNLAKHGQVNPDKATELEIIPSRSGDEIILTVYRLGEVVADNEVLVFNGTEQTIKTDSKGQVKISAGSEPQIWARTRFIRDVAGTHNDQNYSEIREYATVVVDLDQVTASSPAPSAEPQGETATDSAVVGSLPEIPVGITGFSAAKSNGHLYVFGGNTGPAHDYSARLQNGNLWALDLDSPREWKTLYSDRGIQGLALVEFDGAIYRIGGFESRNSDGEPADLHSLDHFAKFDFEKQEWIALPSLPEPRSSFDAVVVDHHVYVIGGWALSGPDSGQWRTTAWRFDLLKPEGAWEALPNPPFQRRAIAVGHLDGSIYVVGGMESTNEVTRKVSILDLKELVWRDGPELPEQGSRMEGFGSSCFNVGGKLVASTLSGTIYQLSPGDTEWQQIGKLDKQRFFHRLVALDDEQFAIIGGANMETGKIKTVVVGKVADP